MPTAINRSDKHANHTIFNGLKKFIDHKKQRIKRLIYISSILGMIQQVRDPDLLLVNKLNQVMHAASCPDAYVFPMYVKSMIWKNTPNVITLGRKLVPVCELDRVTLTSDEYELVGSHFARTAPKWLNYGTFEEMTKDVCLLIGELKRFQMA